MTMVKKILSVVLLCAIILSFCACKKAATVEEAVENADALVSTWNAELLGCCSYETEFKRSETTYWVYARFADAVNNSNYSAYVRTGLIGEIAEKGYPELAEEFKGFDVNVIILVMDNDTLYCGIEDGEINYID